MKLLILGGTIFLGRHLVDVALQRGHDVTLFNRGQHNPDLFPDVEKLQGDRYRDLSLLEGRSWDAVIDTCGYTPRAVGQAATKLAGSVDHYTFISSISVYADTSIVGLTEDSPVRSLPAEPAKAATSLLYGPLKAAAERAAEQAMPHRTLVIRPGLIVGPHDDADRFAYWPRRVAQGGQVLAPGRPDKAIQVIDVRDLASWNIHMAETGATGVFNATGPDYVLTMGQFLEACKEVSGSDARIVWVDEVFLLEAGVTPFEDLPVWMTDAEELHGFHAVDSSRAIGAGLTFRPIERTVADTLTWDRARAPDIQYKAGISREREQKLLDTWQSRERQQALP
jgi:2'-hydroxyisoflavone reductase